MVPSRLSGPSNRLANQAIWRVADASHRISIHPACTFSVEARGPEPPCSLALGESIDELAAGQSSAGHRELLSTLRLLPCQAVKSIQCPSQFPKMSVALCWTDIADQAAFPPLGAFRCMEQGLRPLLGQNHGDACISPFFLDRSYHE